MTAANLAFPLKNSPVRLAAARGPINQIIFHRGMCAFFPIGALIRHFDLYRANSVIVRGTVAGWTIAEFAVMAIISVAAIHAFYRERHPAMTDAVT